MSIHVECSDKTPLHRAAVEGRLEEVKMLIASRGADVNAQTRRGRAPLHYAAENGHCKIVNLLLRSRAKVNLPNKWGRAALHYAASKHRVDCVKILINNGADLDWQDVDAQTPLYHAVAASMYDDARELGTHERITEMTDAGGRDSTMLDSGMRDTEVRDTHLKVHRTLLLLITNGANPDTPDKSGITPLHVAAEQGNAKICSYLIKEGKANINAVDQHGSTPLHYACFQGRRPIADLLLYHGACSTIQDNSGLLPETYLEKQSNYPISYIHRNGCDINRNESEVSKSLKIIDGIPFSAKEEALSSFLLQIEETEGLGRVKQTEEVQRIERDIRYYIETTLQLMSREQPRLRYALVRAGSTAENTKVGEPDELDYMCCLRELSNVSYPYTSPSDPPGYARIKVESHGLKTWGDLVNKDGFVEAEKLHQWFHFIFDRFSETSDLTAMSGCLHKMRDYKPRPELGVTVDMSKTKPGSRLYFMWRGCQFKRLIISVDLIPVIEIIGWPHAAQVPPQNGCDRYHVIPKVSLEIRTNPSVGLFWRVSTALAEGCLFNGMEPAERACYTVCKSLVYHPDPQKLLSHYTNFVSTSFPGSFVQLDVNGRESGNEDTRINSIMCEDINKLSSVLDQLSPYKDDIHSYHLKMIFLRLREQRKKIYDWKTSSVGQRVLEILNMLLEELRQSCVLSYFLLDYNELSTRKPDPCNLPL